MSNDYKSLISMRFILLYIFALDLKLLKQGTVNYFKLPKSKMTSHQQYRVDEFINTYLCFFHYRDLEQIIVWPAGALLLPLRRT